MGLGGGTDISQYRVRFSRDLLMMNVMFETSVLSVNWRGSAVGMRSDGLVGESYQILRLSTCDWDWVTPLAFRRECVSQYVKLTFGIKVGIREDVFVIRQNTSKLLLRQGGFRNFVKY